MLHRHGFVSANFRYFLFWRQFCIEISIDFFFWESACLGCLFASYFSVLLLLFVLSLLMYFAVLTLKKKHCVIVSKTCGCQRFYYIPFNWNWVVGIIINIFLYHFPGNHCIKVSRLLWIKTLSGPSVYYSFQIKMYILPPY